MTKFINGYKRSEPKKEIRKTVFTHFVNADKEIEESALQPINYRYVEFLFYDVDYGDVFKTWDDQEDYVTLHFGIKGDEDYENYE